MYKLMFCGVAPVTPSIRKMLTICEGLGFQILELEQPIIPGSHVVVFFESANGLFPKGGLLSAAEERFKERGIIAPEHVKKAAFKIAINQKKVEAGGNEVQLLRRLTDGIRMLAHKIDKCRKRSAAKQQREHKLQKNDQRPVRRSDLRADEMRHKTYPGVSY